MKLIEMKNPIVEMDGDEMTRVMWQMIKDELLSPFVSLCTEYYDLGLQHRDETDDRVTVEAARATKVHRVAVKCATITPNAQRVEEYSLKKMWSSPNATIRATLDGTVFRTPILTPRIRPYIPGWTRPITIARHAYGDVYKAVEYRVPGKGKAELVFTDEHGTETFRRTVYEYEGPGVLQGMHNKDSSIRSFARACCNYALLLGQDLWFSTKDTISKQYDQIFKFIFQEVYETEFADRFRQAGISYFYTLIDDAVARAVRSEGGFVWACKNYDGDVMSDMVSTAYGSLAMMSSVLVSPDGCYEYEAAHGTITRHYYRYLKGERTSSNPMATIFAWSGALRKRGQLDGTPELCAFADKLEQACLDTIGDGIMTGDLAILCGDDVRTVTTADMLTAIRAKLTALLA
ncbi:MAG: NADP-dependent isocitrate dehydrogenase [Eubacteriales bacterium]